MTETDQPHPPGGTSPSETPTEAPPRTAAPGGRRQSGKTRRRKVRRRHSPAVRLLARTAFYVHLWLGVLVTVLAVSLAVTGVLLNHKKVLGLQPSADNAAPAPLAASLPLAELAERARAEHPDGDAAPIDRMDVRPDDGLVKVRFDDPATTEVTLALDDGRVLENAPRQDVFLERLHSGEIFGDGWILLSDAAAVGLLLLVVSGTWIWLFPRWRQ